MGALSGSIHAGGWVRGFNLREGVGAVTRCLFWRDGVSILVLFLRAIGMATLGSIVVTGGSFASDNEPVHTGVPWVGSFLSLFLLVDSARVVLLGGLAVLFPYVRKVVS